MESLGGRLRYERERRQINLRSIAETTKISVPLLEGLERDDVSRWPSGIFRKSFIRVYAQAIGLDPDPVVREFVERYPDPHDAEIEIRLGRCGVSDVASALGQAHHYLERISDGRHRLVRLEIRLRETGRFEDRAVPAVLVR